MLIKNTIYLTADMKFEQGSLLVEDGRIYTNPCELADEVLDASEYIILPGLVNAHFHSYSSLAKGLGKEAPIQEWCDESIRGQIQMKFFNDLDYKITEQDFVTLGLYSYIGMIKQGITFISDTDPGNTPLLLAEAINRLGLRGVVEAHSQYGAYHGKEVGNVRFSAHLLEEEDITEETLQQCVELEQAYKPLKLTHCMENGWRDEIVRTSFGKSSVELYEDHNLLDERTVLFHGVYLSPKDIRIIASHNASVVHCPVSNLWSGAGAADVNEMLKSGVNVCLGTDYASTNMWEEMRMAYHLLKLNSSVDEFSAEDILKMATSNGAKAYQEGHELGKIANGYKADLIFIKKDISLYPLINSESFSTYAHNLLTQCNQNLIDHVMVGGRWVMKDKKIQTIDEDAIVSEYTRISQKLFV